MAAAVVDRINVENSPGMKLPFEFSAQQARRRSIEVGEGNSSSTVNSWISNEKLGATEQKEITDVHCGQGGGNMGSKEQGVDLNNVEKKNQSLLVPGAAVLSSNYNFTVLAAAMVIMSEDNDLNAAANDKMMKSTLKMLCYGGAVIGQLTMGYVGDAFGRRVGMIITLSLVVLGSLCSAACSWGSAYTMFSVMCLWRFVLGVGNGGTYPLSAVAASEGTASAENRSPRVSYAYMMNVPGIIGPYLLGLILYVTCKSSEVAWRLLMGIGCIPALVVFSAAWKMEDAEEYEKVKYSKKLMNGLKRREYWSRLLGTGGAWFLYDVAAYGILLIQPDITKSIFGQSTSVVDTLWQGIVLNAVGIPGVAVGILVIKQMGLKWLQFYGFAFLGIAAFAFAIASSFTSCPAWLQMLLLCVVNFLINWGASISTFILPSEVFPPECRSTYNGISAAMGKVGAVVGIYSFQAVHDSMGVSAMMCLAGLTCALGCILTFCFIGPFPRTRKARFMQAFAALFAIVPCYDFRPILGLEKHA